VPRSADFFMMARRKALLDLYLNRKNHILRLSKTSSKTNPLTNSITGCLLRLKGKPSVERMNDFLIRNLVLVKAWQAIERRQLKLLWVCLSTIN
jgi:hypothetical protein